MDINWLSVFTVMGAVAGIVVLSGSVLVYLKGSYSKAKIEALRGDLADLRQKHADADTEKLALENKYTALEVKYSSVINERNVLAELVTQKAQVDEVKLAVIRGVEILEEHHSESLDAWSAIVTQLTHLEGKLKQ